MNKWIVLLAFLVMAYTEIVAQSLTGRVVDEQRTPLEAVSVVLLEKSSKKPLVFTRTDANGHFVLSFSEKKKDFLRFAYSVMAKTQLKFSTLSQDKPLS